MKSRAILEFVLTARLGAIVAGVLALTASAALGAATKTPAPPACPSPSLVTAKLNHKIVKHESSIAHFTWDPAAAGLRGKQRVSVGNERVSMEIAGAGDMDGKPKRVSE